MAHIALRLNVKKALLLATGALFFLTVPAISQEADIPTKWYQALEKADVETLGNLLAENATIELTDLDIVQTKVEFLSSMDDWSDAIEGGSIHFKTESMDQDKITQSVCYGFRSNELLTEEIFVINQGQIFSNIQKEISDDCGDLSAR